MLSNLIIALSNGQLEYPLESISPRWPQVSRVVLEPTQLLPLLLGFFLLVASPLQFTVFKHDAYRSLALVCMIGILTAHYLSGHQSYRVSRAYVITATGFSLWGVLAASWASAGHQALLFALLPPLFFLAIPVLAMGWRSHPLAASLSLAGLALALFSADAVMALASQAAGDTPYRMPWMSSVQSYLFYNSRDANQFHTLLIWSGLPCLWLAVQNGTIRLKCGYLTAMGLAIPALGLFLILNSQGDGALLAVLAGAITSAGVLRGPWRHTLALFALGLGLGALAFVAYNTLTNTGSLFGDVVERNVREFSRIEGGRLHTWGRHLSSVVSNGLWNGAGYRAIPAGSKQCDPHNVVIALGYWLGLPGLLLIGAWVKSLNWSLSRHPACVQALLPGTFASFAVYQLVDAIWGFAPSVVLLCLLFAMVSPLLAEGDPGWEKALPWNKNWALIGIALATLFFLLAQQPGFNAGHPARRVCLMAFGTDMQVKFGGLPNAAVGTSGGELR